MDFSAIPLVSIMKSKMGYLAERQTVLAQNVANADTPKYKARDVSAPDFSKMLAASGVGATTQLKMAATNSHHMTGGAGDMSYHVIQRAKTDELNPNGNNVSIEEEMANVGTNQAEYTKVLNLYSKMVSMFKTAAGVQGNG